MNPNIFLRNLANGKLFYISLGVILLIGLFLRVLYPATDAPIGFTKSQDINTDPFAYTMFARDYVQFGDSNPFDDPRWVVWQKSLQTVFSVVVYELFGTGRAQGELVSVIMYLLAIFLLALGIKNFGSRLGALLAAYLAVISFTMVVFARIPFVEASLNLWLCASFYFFSLGSKRAFYYALSGMCAAAAGFFGKLTGLFSIGIFAAVWIFWIISVREDAKKNFRNAIIFFASFAAVGVVWFLYVYLPSSEIVSWYYSEQGVGLYGSPKAFHDLKQFFWGIQNLLWERGFFRGMPIATILAFFGIALYLRKIADSIASRNLRDDLTIGSVALVFWFLFAYAALFPLNYRPLRYQAVLFLPLMGIAGIFLENLYLSAMNSKKKSRKQREKESPIWLNTILIGLIMAPLVCSILLVNGSKQFAGSVFNSIYAYTFLFIATGAAAYLLLRFGRNIFDKLRPVAGIAVLLVLIAYGVVNIWSYYGWMSTRQYSLLAADHDLGAILGGDAVVSGSYGTALAQDNGLHSIHHQFGITTDPEFFNKYPITHLVIDKSNEEIARKEYPQIMSGASIVTDYLIRGFPVKVFRISDSSPNPQARAYKLTDYETALKWEQAGEADSAQYYMNMFLQSDSISFSARVHVAMKALDDGRFPNAIENLRKAFVYSYKSAQFAYMLGVSYYNMASKTSQQSYIDSALVYLEYTHKLMPNDKNVEKAVMQLKRAR